MTALTRVASKQVSRQSQMPLGMAQLALRGLSEDWWLKHLGDVHWQLIAKSVGQNTTVFKDNTGRQIYAAFCATEFDQPHPDRAGLGENLGISSTLWSAGRSRLQSIHTLQIADVTVATFRLISTFVCHEKGGVNASISRTMPYIVPVLDPAPDNFAAKTSAAVREYRGERNETTDSVLIHPCIGADFNAVGLLYFPSFSRFFDQTERALGPPNSWSPVRQRQVLYFSNIERGDAIAGRPSHDGLELWSVTREGAYTRKLAHCETERF